MTASILPFSRHSRGAETADSPGGLPGSRKRTERKRSSRPEPHTPKRVHTS